MNYSIADVAESNKRFPRFLKVAILLAFILFYLTRDVRLTGTVVLVNAAVNMIV